MLNGMENTTEQGWLNKVTRLYSNIIIQVQLYCNKYKYLCNSNLASLVQIYATLMSPSTFL